MRNHPLHLALASLVCGLGACTNANNPTVANGACAIDPTVDCTTDGVSAESLGLVPYSCMGAARPDQDPTYIDGVPQGLVCANQESPGTDGRQGYCCSAQITPCAYNPIAICDDPGTYGYQCRGADRPEALNDAIHCNQGVRRDDLIDYCCSGVQRTAGCTASQSVGCLAGIMGWICPPDTLPTAQDLAANQSRADVYYQLCPVPTPAANPNYEIFCCFTPGLVPPGGTCVQDIKVPGCQPGRFGIACYGPDTPDQDYPRLSCPDPGFPGVSAEGEGGRWGYPATLYCCDFQ